MPTVRPLAEWPELLSGPILRRVTPRSVAVFAAFKSAGTVELSVGVKGSTATRPTATAPTLSLGDNLHVCVVEYVAPTTTAFTPGVTYEYQLRYQAAGSTAWKSLKDLGVLSGAYPLGYVADALPTFALPPGLKNLRVVYGSCRKAHAPGPDALPLVDRMIEERKDLPLERPHQLLLGGDQIYSDDVALSLLKSLTATAGILLAGWSHLELIAGTTFSGTVDWTSSRVTPGPSRKEFVTKETTFSSGEIEGHLLFFGEFVAMYMFAWSDALWPRASDGTVTLPLVVEMPELLQALDVRAQIEKQAAILEARGNALVYARTLPRVRRALANVPTYMIFDDHEITDDWFIDYTWDQNARHHIPTRQIVRNGLLAYAVFQDWGNHPENYASGQPGRMLLDNLKYSSGFNPPVLDQSNICDALLDIRDPSLARTPLTQRLLWDYHVEGPEHVVIALDTRTFRGYTSLHGHAGLISSESMQRQIDDRRTAVPNKLPIIISAAPVLGHPLLEVVQEVLVECDLPLTSLIHHGKPVETADYEAWGGNRPRFEEFLSRVSIFGRAVLVSGDVHYAFSNHLAYFPDGGSPPSRIVQLCSSAFKNESKGTRIVGAAGYRPYDRKNGWLGFDEDLADPMRTDLLDAIQAGMKRDDVGAALAAVKFEITRSGRFSKPAVIQSGPWKTPQATAIVSALADDLVTKQSRTNWRYTIEYLKDTRTAAARESDAGLGTVLAGVLNHLTRAMVLDWGRLVLGENNVGRVHFETDAAGAAIKVVHRLYWQPRSVTGSIIAGAVMFTEMKAPLTPPTSVERPTVTQ